MLARDGRSDERFPRATGDRRYRRRGRGRLQATTGRDARGRIRDGRCERLRRRSPPPVTHAASDDSRASAVSAETGDVIRRPTRDRGGAGRLYTASSDRCGDAGVRGDWRDRAPVLCGTENEPGETDAYECATSLTIERNLARSFSITDYNTASVPTHDAAPYADARLPYHGTFPNAARKRGFSRFASLCFGHPREKSVTSERLPRQYGARPRQLGACALGPRQED